MNCAINDERYHLYRRARRRNSISGFLVFENMVGYAADANHAARVSSHAGLCQSPRAAQAATHGLLRRLQANGIISRYVALIDPATAGLSVTAFARVRLEKQDDQRLKTFEAMVTSFPEVMDCCLITGDCDYQLRVLVASLDVFEDFLRHRLTKIDGVSQLTTSIGLRPVVNRTALPFPSC